MGARRLTRRVPIRARRLEMKETNMKSLRLIGVCIALAVGASAVFAGGAWALEAPELGQCLAQTGGKYTNDICTKLATGKKVGK